MSGSQVTARRLATDAVARLLRQLASERVWRPLLSGAASVTAGLTVGCAGGKSVSDTQSTGPVTAGEGDGSQPARPADATLGEVAADSGGPLALPGCVNGQWAPRAAALHTSTPFDYLSVRQRWGVPLDDGTGPESWTQATFTLLSEHGQKCATAQQPECLQTVQRHPDELVGGTCSQLCSERSVVTTRGDRVERWAGAARLSTLLAPIDSADEALLLAFAAGYDVPCGDTAELRAVEQGFALTGQRLTSLCDPVETTAYQLAVSTSGQLRVLDQKVLSTQAGLCIGRVPEGLASESHDQKQSELGDYLARCAHLEAASVVAFERLARELLACGAPAALIDAALRAATDEVRHAALLTRLAEARGGKPSSARVSALPLRELEEIALENATEGCVRETYGALVGAYQAEHAADRELASALSTIAADEAQHAALSHDVHAWALAELDEPARVRVVAAQARAIERLESECAHEPSPALREQAGLPPAELARAFVAELRRSLWSTAAPRPPALPG
jgi:hypothetical protein